MPPSKRVVRDVVGLLVRSRRCFARFLICFAVLTPTLGGCGSPETARSPDLAGDDAAAWLTYQVAVQREPKDLLPAFEASAQNYGCKTERLSSQSDFMQGGVLFKWYGVGASCPEG